MKRSILLVLVCVACVFAFTQCKKKQKPEPNKVETEKKDSGVVRVETDIKGNVTWTSNNVYILTKRISVVKGAKLTIEPGTIIKGEAGQEANATALIVARGAQIFANGTAQKPIIFTSVSDKIMPGQIESPNLKYDATGLWGGVIVLGNAPISAKTPEAAIEGIPASDVNGLYGGDKYDDNSGVLTYVSIRHGGANIGEGNEINGLTLGGVGNGTKIENIEIIANDDDGIEFFGGCVNVTNIIVWNVLDDCIDVDQSWSGTVDNFVIIAGKGTDNCLEIDGPEGTMEGRGVIKNGTIKGFEGARLGDFRDGAMVEVSNVFFYDFPAPDGKKGVLMLTDKEGANSVTANLANGKLNFKDIEIDTPVEDLSKIFLNGTVEFVKAVKKENKTVGANVSKFMGWSIAAKKGGL